MQNGEERPGYFLFLSHESRCVYLGGQRGGGRGSRLKEQAWGLFLWFLSQVLEFHSWFKTKNSCEKCALSMGDPSPIVYLGRQGTVCPMQKAKHWCQRNFAWTNCCLFLLHSLIVYLRDSSLISFCIKYSIDLLAVRTQGYIVEIVLAHVVWSWAVA